MIKNLCKLTRTNASKSVNLKTFKRNYTPDLVTKIGDMNALGVGGYFPPGIISQCLEFIHVSTGMPWYISIAATTVAFRLLTFPVVVEMRKKTQHLQKIQPEIQAAMYKYDVAKKSGASQDEVKSAMLEIHNIYRKNNLSPAFALKGALIQAPIFLSSFWALQNITALPVESFKTGGALWFNDLTIPDPYYVLPVVNALSFYMVTSCMDVPQSETQQKVFKLIALGTFPFVCMFPSALPVYWVTSNLFTILSSQLFKSPLFCRWININPSPVKVSPPSSDIGFFESLKDSAYARDDKKDQKKKSAVE
jgi:YidC/Oxa1 family membrane protein insertase